MTPDYGSKGRRKVLQRFEVKSFCEILSLEENYNNWAKKWYLMGDHELFLLLLCFMDSASQLLIQLLIEQEKHIISNVAKGDQTYICLLLWKSNKSMQIVIDLSLSQRIPEYSTRHTRFCKVVKHKPVTTTTTTTTLYSPWLSWTPNNFFLSVSIQFLIGWLINCQANRKSGTL